MRWLLLLLVGCGSQRRGEAIVGPLALAEAEAVQGRMVFMKRCESCHPGGEAGLGPALTNSPAPVWLAMSQVRIGAGAMPAFGKDQISPDDLSALAAWLRALKRHRPVDTDERTD